MLAKFILPFILLFSGFIFLSCSVNDDSDIPFGSGNFTVSNGNIDLATRLWLPGNDKYPVMIIVEGSAADPKEDFEPNAKLLTENGIAVLAYDKRGHFSSTGPTLVPDVANSILTFRFLASDLISIVDFLKTHKNVDESQIGVFCSSQGVWICAEAQGKKNDIKFAINLVGSATSVGIENYYSQLTGNDLHGNNLSDLTIQEIDSLVSLYDGPQGFDPLPYLKEIDNEQLWVFGELDFGNPTRQSTAILNDLINTANKDISMVVVPNANHSLIDITNNHPFEIGDLVAPWLLEKIFNENRK